MQVVKQEHFDKGSKEMSLNETLSPGKKVEKDVEKTQQAAAANVISQTEQLLTAMRFSSKTAASFNNFIEGRNLRSKSTR